MENFGDFILLKEIGEGPFSKVYLAEHRFIKKQFALKVLNQGLTQDSGFVERFERLISQVVSLDHPSIVKVHNISYAEGSYFLVMDPIVDSVGETLHLDRYLDLKGQTLNEAEMEDILMQIAAALDYAHNFSFEDRYLAHGGLKLSNLLVGKKDRHLRVYLSDFGFSHILSSSLMLARKCERVSLALHTELPSQEKSYALHRSFLRDFHFLAPEQKIFSSSFQIDFSVDAYAFGVLAYFLITKTFPEGCFEPIFKEDLDYQFAWDHLIFRCLQKNPTYRPAYLVKALEEIRDKEKKGGYLWSELGKKVEDIMQMSFTFAGQEAEKKALAKQAITKESNKETISSSVSPLSFYPAVKEPSLKPLLKPQEIHRPQYEPDPGAIFQKELSVSRYQPAKVEEKEVEPILTDMVIIPGGTYSRGSNHGARDEMPRHAVTVFSFAVDIHPVTNEQFVRFLMAMGGEKDGNNNDLIRLRDARIKRTGGKLTIESGYARHPVVGVTWYGATAYAKWIGKRLPTEAEWEIASYGGKEGLTYPTGDDIERSKANFFSSDTTSVMSYPPNDYGLYDMAGNVYEWCQDWYAYNYYDISMQEPENPQGPPQGVYRVLRGGCWKSLKEDLRCSHRHRNNPGAVNGTYGFRCAADVVSRE